MSAALALPAFAESPADPAAPARRPTRRGWVWLAAVPAAVACGNFFTWVLLAYHRSPLFVPAVNEWTGRWIDMTGGNGPTAVVVLPGTLAGPGAAAGLLWMIGRGGRGDRTWKPAVYGPAAWACLTVLVAAVMIALLMAASVAG